MQIPHLLEQEQRIISKLQEAKGPLHAEDLVDKYKTPKDSQEALKRLLGQGRVKVSKEGLISLL